MDNINKLLSKAKAAYRRHYTNGVGFVEYDPVKKRYIANAQPWDGINGSVMRSKTHLPNWWCNFYGTSENATEALERLFVSYGIQRKNTVILVDGPMED